MKDAEKKGLAFSLVFIFVVVFFVYADVFDEMSKPYVELAERVQLLGYMNYAVVFASIPLFGGLTVSMFLSFFNVTFSPKVWNGFAVFVLIVMLCGCVSRYYLGFRVDQKNYVLCPKESRTSAKSSWRVYAVDASLCLDSSGIAGG